jgi:hypothetical protein
VVKDKNFLFGGGPGNGVRVLILRGVTDLVHGAGGEAYGNLEVFQNRSRTIMRRLFAELPFWLDKTAAR